MPVGGVMPKIRGAIENGIGKFIVPKSNFEEISDFLTPDITSRIEVVAASNFDEVI
jgi:predicted ATP-dependent protease